ncbi:MAG: hypothetical protein QM537_08565 [Candidatus Symbiobacter sp.]|nr:hypothetical protein [Candidatus Symbiobacter sp.]
MKRFRKSRLFMVMMSLGWVLVLAGCGGGSRQFAKLHPYAAGGNFGYEEKWAAANRAVLRYTSKLQRTKNAPDAPENVDQVQLISKETIRLVTLRAAQLADAKNFPYFRILKQASSMESSQFSSSGNNAPPPPPMVSGGYMTPGGGFTPIITRTPSVENSYTATSGPQSQGYGYQIKTAIEVELLSNNKNDNRAAGEILSTQEVLAEGKVYLDEAAALAR